MGFGRLLQLLADQVAKVATVRVARLVLLLDDIWERVSECMHIRIYSYSIYHTDRYVKLLQALMELTGRLVILVNPVMGASKV